METDGGWAQASDAELVVGVRAEDWGALHELFLRHGPWLTARLTHRCADTSIVDEAVSDTFLAVWRNPGWRAEGEVGAWLWGIAIRSLLHRLQPRRDVVDLLVTLRSSDAASAEEEVLARVQYSTVGVALERLSPELRAVVQARVLDGLTTREAAFMLGIPNGTVKSRMSRARLELREAMTGPPGTRPALVRGERAT
ncbi:RNA polymerase sigma factor [Nocardioides zhouii]|uniref:Sigma-70 family RNA polymerase sigma factor n=1 Tax=Nocardioides zhouii TaxID=1168729 RepID=A0A4Q2SYQ4_9ACTN|nr:sigma-70 family RNA polymerase sigma factor [Nocardioides zhouii]RYC10783.1 sigma-70 family RNA polymerase sigma factor [Nocardioides zhouii]